MSVHSALLISTTCQRFSLGFFLFSVVASRVFGVALPMGTVCTVALIFLVIGGIASMVHLGRPTRFLNSFSNPHSHLSQEAILLPFLGAALALCCLDTLFFQLGAFGAVLQWIAAVLAVCFLVCTGLVYQLYARPAWDTPLVLLIFLLTSAEIGTLSVLSVAGANPPVSLLVLAGLALGGCVVVQYLFLQRLTGLKYGTAVRMSTPPYRSFFVVWLLAGVLAPVLAMIGIVLTGQSGYATAGAASSIIGIMVWTALYFKSALKVRMFPMYKVDLNVYM